MRETSNRFVLFAALAIGLMLCGPALAYTQVEDFDNLIPNAVYGAWADVNVTTITSGPTSLTVESLGWGGAWDNLYPLEVDGTGETTVELDVTVHSGIAGVIVALGDTGLTEWNYAWYGLPAGDYLLTAPISSYTYIGAWGDDGVLDQSALGYIHIQVDPGTSSDPYSVSYKDLSLTGIPEPTSLALLLTGIGLFVALRRR